MSSSAGFPGELVQRKHGKPGGNTGSARNAVDDNGKSKFEMRYMLNGPGNDSERLLVRVVRDLAVIIAFVIFWFIFPVLLSLAEGNLGCPTWNGKECNGKGTCGLGGHCVATDPRFSGNALQVSACPLYDSGTGGVCGGRGVCSPFMRFEDVPVQCRWITPSIANGFRPKNQRGWDHPECVAFLRAKRQNFARGDFSGNDTAGVPTCICYGAADGPDCQYTACPTALNNLVCSGRGDPVVHLFKNTSETIGDGCQCTHPFSFFDQAVISTLSQDQRLALHRQVDQLQQPFCGRLERTPTGGLYVSKSVVGQFSSDHFKCFCQEAYFGLGCEYGRCPMDEFGRVCSGQGHPAFGFEAPEAVRTCRTLCTSPDSTRCAATDTCVFPRRDFTDRDQLCTAQPKCPEESRFRCPDGTCVSDAPLDVTMENACALGYTTASLDAAWLDAKRDQVRCLGVFDECLPSLYNGTHTIIPQDTVSGIPFASPPIWAFMVLRTVQTDQAATLIIQSDVAREEFVQVQVPPNTSVSVFAPFSNLAGSLVDFVTQTTVTVLGRNELVVGFYNAIPVEWEDVRLERNDGEYLRILSMDLRTEYGSGGVHSHILLPFLNGFLLPDTSVRTEASCLANTLPCVWNYNSPTSITSGSGQWACWNGFVWSVSNSMCNANATFAPYFPVRSVLHVAPRLASVSLVPGDVWNVQFLRSRVSQGAFNLTLIARGADLFVEEVELLQSDDVHAPCACQPGLVQRNRTIQNNRVAFDDERRRTVFVAGEYVVVPVVEYGQMHPERGKVVSSTPNTTRVSLRRPGGPTVHEFPTRQARAMSAVEFIHGLDDCDVNVFHLRCPTGFCAEANALERIGSKECNCTGVAGSLDMTQCTCTDGVQCTCSTDACDCSGAALPFERALLARIHDLDANCSCFSLPNTQTQEANFSSSVFVDTLIMDTSKTLLAIIAPICTAVDVYGIDDSLAALAPPQLLVNVGYGCLNATYMEIVVFSIQQWTSLFIAGLPPNTEMQAQWLDRPLARVADMQSVVYSASSNDVFAIEASRFIRGTSYWASVTSFVEQPVWLSVSWSTPVPIEGFIVAVRSAAIDVDLPVELQIQGRVFGTPTWYILATLVSDANDVDEPARHWLPAQDIRLVDEVRIVSLFPMALYEFVPMIRQGCTCLSFQQPVLMSSAPDLDTPSILTSLLPRFLALNDTDVDAPCTCTDTCAVRTDGGIVVNVANDGVCNDELFHVRQNNISREDFFIQGQVESMTAFEFMLQSFFVNVDGQNTSSCFAQAFYGTPMVVVLHWCDGTAQPTQTDADAAYALFDVWNVTRANNLSSAVAFAFLDPADNITLLQGDDWLFQSTLYTRQRNITIQRFGPALGNQLVCHTGEDCTDCGSSNRNVDRAPFLTCDPLTPRERLIVQDLLNQTVLLTPAWRLLGEYRRQFSVHHLVVSFQEILWYPDCGPDVCPSPTESRCPDGTCARECVVEKECDRSGCITSDVNSDQYACACRQGWGGARCEYDATVAADPFRALIDPNRYARCGGPPPMREQPHDIALKTIVAPSNTDMERRNRAWKPANIRQETVIDPTLGLLQIRDITTDVQYLRVKPRHAPYGFVVLRQHTLPNGDTIQTDCPPAHRGPLGQYLTLDDDVKTRDPITGEVLEWTTYTKLDGSTIQYTWTNAFSRDDLPYRCANGLCVESPAECKVSITLHPLCNNHGHCRPDGTCECAAGYTTFLFTEKFTRRAVVPYAYDDAKEHTVPQTWFAEPNFNWRDFGPKWCAARDCSLVDCSVPYGCPTGTPENEFRDKWVRCSSRVQIDPKSAIALPRLNKCGQTEEDCQTNTNLIDTLPCSGNGVPRRRDYRDPPEYYCECGTPISKSASINDVSETVQLRPNGYGGDDCRDYYCNQGQDSLHFSTFDPDTGQAYTDLGVPLPGLWKGFCGVPIGPDPLEINEWQACCSETRLDRCTSIPCRVANEISCFAPQACIRAGGTPLVYPCNSHGDARRDGTCACTTDEEQGTGYTANTALFSRPNCFKPLKCPRSNINNAPCRRISACSEPEEWTHPPDDLYFTRQLPVYFGRLGYTISNRTIVRESTDIVEKEKTLEAAMTTKALQTQDQVRGIQSCICVSSPFEDPFAPTGMVPLTTQAQVNVVFPYGRGYRAPYQFVNFTFDSVLAFSTVLGSSLTTWANAQLQARWNDGYFSETDPPYVAIPADTTVRIVFDSPKTFSLVRMHALVPQVGLSIGFTDDAGNVVCARFTLADTTRVGTWGWFTMFCTPVYRDFQFQVAFPREYTDFCGADETTLNCIDWQQRVCPGEFREAGSLNVFRGCVSNCCIATEVFAADPSVVLRATFSHALVVDEWRVFGFANRTTEMPPALKYEFKRIAGDGDAAACTQAPDQRFAQQYLGTDKRFYIAGKVDTSVPITDTNSARVGFASPLQLLSWQSNANWCRTTGGWLASTRSVVRQNPGFDPTLYDEAVKTRFENAATDASRAFIGLRNVLAKTNPTTSDYVYDQCQLHGCVHFMQPDMGGVIGPVYAAKFPNQYKSNWLGYPFVLPWTYLLDPTRVLQRTPLPVSFDVGTEPVCDITLYEALNGEVVYTRSPSWDPCCDSLSRLTLCLFARGWDYPTTNSICDASYPTGQVRVRIKRNTFVQFNTNIINALRYENTGFILRLIPPRSMRITATQNCVIFVCLVEPCDVNQPAHTFKYEFPEPSNRVINFLTSVTTNILTGQTISVPFAPKVIKTLPISPHYKGVVRVNADAYSSNDGNQWFNNGAQTSQVMGWKDYPYMCMQVQYSETERTEPLPNYAGVNYQPTNIIYTDTGPVNWTPSILVRSASSLEIHGCETLNNFVPPCTSCERSAPAKWQWDSRVFPSSGVTFPDDQPNAGFLTPSVPVFVYGRKNQKLGAGGNPDGLDAQPDYYGLDYFKNRDAVRLQAMRSDPDLRRHYAWFSCNIDISKYNQPFVVAGWTHPHCGTVVNANGRLEPFPCIDKLPGVCQHDFTQHITLPGRSCDKCGPSTRSGGFATPGRTCFDEFPLANRTANPFGFLVLDNYLAGTLNLLVSTTQYDYDVASEYLSNVTGLFWAAPGARELWDQDFSDVPLQASPGVRENAYSGINFAISRIWPEDCGWQISKETGIARRRCAAQKEYCNPDAPQRHPFVIDPETLPTILRPVDETTDVRFEPTCATAARPSTYVVRDRYGGPTSFGNQFQIILSDPLFLRVRLVNENSAVFNTGKNPHYYTFQANLSSTVAGQVDFTCATCSGPTTFRVWIAPLNPNYLYPSNPFVIGSFVLQGGPVLVTHRYAFDVNLAPQDVFSNIHGFANVTYQVVGWDIQNAKPDAVVQIGNALITDAKTIAECRRFRGRLPMYGPKSSVDSGAPDNVCLMTQEDIEYYGGGNLGECWCDKPMAGANCDAPAITTRFGKFALGGWGEGGRASTPLGTLVATSTLADELGVYSYQVTNTRTGALETVVTGKCRQVGRILRTRLQSQPAYDYLKLFLLENTLDAVLYVEVFEGATNFMDLDDVLGVAASASVALASWVSAAEATQYLALASNSKLPLFVDLERRNVTEDGNANLIWRTRGLTFRKCAEPSVCDIEPGVAPAPVELPSPVDCAPLGPWGNTVPTTYCAGINFNNLLYTVPLGAVDLTDGKFFGVPVTTPFSFPTPSPLSAFTFYIWMSSSSATASITTVACGCTTGAPSFVGLNAYLQVFECVPLAGTLLCTVLTSPATTPIFEVQIFNATDATRVPFYPY